MNTNKTIYIIRHGETDFNRTGVIQGSGIDSDLNAHGMRQATCFYSRYKSERFDKIYTSQLKRTIQSVEPFLSDGYAYEALAELNEINWGVFEGKRSNPGYKERYNEIISLWRMGILDVPIEGGESPIEMFTRQQVAAQRILTTEFKKILVCMHGRAMRSFLSLLLQTPLKDMDDYDHSNLCLYVLDMNGEKGTLRLSNDTQHLETLIA